MEPSITTRNGTLAKDLLASVVVFLVALPLCLGIAIASGAPPAAGLITGIIGGLIVGMFSGCPLQVSGPAAGLAVIVFELIQEHGWEALGPIIVMAGVIQVAAGLLRFGQLFRAIAPAVIYGMLAGIGILIFGAQFHVMVDDRPRESGWQNLLSIPSAIYKGLLPVDGSTHHLAAMLGILTVVVIVMWGRLAPSKLKWIPGALVAVLSATALAQLMSWPVRYVDLPDRLLSSIRLPAVASFSRLLQPEFLIAAVTLAFIASAETLLSAAAVDRMHDGKKTNYDREMVSQGAGNILSGLLGGLPMTGVIVRSATNVAAGAKTRRSAMLHGFWLLVVVALFPTVLRMVPTASLAAVLVYTGFKLVNPENVRRLASYGTTPVVIYAATVVMIVATDLLLGILTGLVLSLLKVLWALSHLVLEVHEDAGRRRADVHLSEAATFLRLPKLVDRLSSIPAGWEVHIHFQHMRYIDHACMDAIADWAKQRTDKGWCVTVEWTDLMEKYREKNGYRSKQVAA